MSPDHGTAVPSVDLAPFLAAFQRLSDLAAEAQQARSAAGTTVAAVLAEHLGHDPRSLPVVTETLSPLRTVDADVALDALAERHGGGRVVGVGGGEQRMHSSLSEIVEQSSQWRQFPVGAVDYTRTATGPDTERRVVSFGLRLLTVDGSPLAVLQRAAAPRFGMEGALEVIAPDQDDALAFLGELREAMITHSMLRGQVVSFTAGDYEATSAGVTFHRRDTVPAADVVLPAGTLDRVTRQVLGVAEHRDRLLSAGQHLKRGVLLYGPPGTGKTHTVRHLVGRADGTTVILLAGGSLQLVGVAAEIARAMQPAVVVLEDCDLIAEDRSFHDGPQPLLFEVLDAMDGLAPDADVAFVLTTNRADLLERALSQRPGRVDLAVEIPLPDAGARRRLFELYGGAQGFGDHALDAAAESTEGVTASFVKEAIRRAVLLAAEDDRAVTDDDLATAVAEMTADGERITRSLLGGAAMDPVDDGEEHDADDLDGGDSFGWFAEASGR
ncbi:AAA family ATPase [Isoptericola sp. NPDC057391]|uniref:AAA family ATPase n=1 Tax=Isoptericola sp. NPDC057391 TaxID=3346117 RepID=UPI00362C426F